MEAHDPSAPTPASPHAFGEIDLWRHWYLLLNQWWMIVLCVAFGLACAMAYLRHTPKIYASTATLEVDTEAKKSSAVQQLMPLEFRGNESLKTTEQALMASSLILRVIEQSGLEQSTRFLPPRSAGLAYGKSELVELFQKKLGVSLRRGTRLIDVTIEDEDPERARFLTELYVKNFLSEDLEQRMRVSRESSAALQKAADDLKVKLEKSERKLQEYREENRAVSLEEKQNIIVDKLKDLNLKATASKEQRLRLESDVAIIERESSAHPEKLLQLASITNNPEVDGLRRRIQEKESEFSALKERYLELHPRYIQAEVQLQELRQSLLKAATKAGEQVIQTYNAAKAVEEKLATALAEQEKASLRLHALSIQYNVLVREVESDRALYAAVLNGLKETNASNHLAVSSLRIMDPPLTPTRPVRPKTLKILLVSSLAGIFLGAFLVHAFDALRGTIRSLNDVEIGLGLPVLASVPAGKYPTESAENVIHSAPQSPEAEAFRFLRTSIGLLGRESEHRVVLFTSAVPDEGKTFCALNYGACLAKQGLRTLLIDANLRHPQLGNMVSDGAPTEEGLSDCLSGSASLSDTFRQTRFFGLFVLSAGHRAPNPSELLGSKAFGELIHEAMERFDRIVIDTSPVNLFSDALVLTHFAQSICMVVRANSTRRRTVLRALRLIARTGRKPDGIILNRVKLRKGADQTAPSMTDLGQITAAGSTR